MTQPATGDLVALAPRLGLLSVLRAGIAAIPVLAATPMFDLVPAERSMLAICGTYAVLVVVAEAVRLVARRPLPLVSDFALVVDGAYVGAVLQLTGGAESPLLFLAFTHVAAVTLLLSHRSGLKVALWHSLLLVPVSTGVDPAVVALAITGYWVVALVTARCSSLNERDLRRSRAGFQQLSEMGAHLSDADSTRHVVRILLASVDGYFPGRRFAVFLHDGGQRLLQVTINGDVREVDVPTGPPLDAVIRRCWASRAPVLVRKLDPMQDPALSDALPGARNLVVVPLFADGEDLGVLVAERGGAPGTRVAASVVAMLEQFAAYAALAARNVSLLSEVRRLATVDDLTQLANRRTFEAELATQVKRSSRTGEPLTLMLLDIDHFKAVNDEHGHQLGDEVLRHVGRALRTGRRPYDLAARYGGEEFAVIMPGADARAALDVAERLRAAVADGAPLAVTASAGIATLVGPAADGSVIVKAADEALYAAKEAGRDRTAVAEPIGETRLRSVS